MEVPMSTKKSVSADVLPITNTIPVPAYATLGKKIGATLAALNVGQSFEIPKEASKALAYRVGLYPTRTFTLKTNKGKIRIWKIQANKPKSKA
jgi:hypothetical protein